MAGRMMGVADSAMMRDHVNMNYTSALVTQKFFIATIPCVVVDISGVPRVAGSGGACTLQVFKAPSGTAVGSGALLHSGTYDLVGTADKNQTLTLVSTPETLRLNPGDSLGYVLTGTATNAVGMIQVTLEPI